VNRIAGAAFGLFGAYALGNHLVAGDFNGNVLMAGLATVFAFGIAGLGLAGLRQPTSPGIERIRRREEAIV
jgi:hypothetical protein